MKIAHIVGARPQLVKYYPVSKAIEKLNEPLGTAIKDILIHTGQHYDYNMSKIFFDELGLKEPDYHLGVGSGTQGKQTGLIIQKTEEVLNVEKPDIVIVYGDTNSTLGGALASVKLNIPIAHVEAGLRSYNRYMPEEINRVLTDHISSILFCPTETAVKNLQKEGFSNIVNNGRLNNLSNISFLKSHSSNSLVINVGDVMYDVVAHFLIIPEKQSKILNHLRITYQNYQLLTLHRAENTDDKKRLGEIVDFVNDISKGKTVVFPMHPRTRKVYKNSNKKFNKNINLIEPVGYFDILMLLKNSTLVMTDSGGMQKEAYWLNVPCITLRDETEWVETVQSGWNILYKNYHGSHKISDIKRAHYGNGNAAERIVSLLIKLLSG